MGNKKYIITAVILTMLCIGFNVAFADNSNSLTQVDVKKSSTADSLDVTFYTTDSNTNTVVTRKGNNRYVVLLPNVYSNSSVTPSIGGLKDLISNVEVKHVDDGIGGYTKVTFDSIKPINIKTYNKKSSPLTQAQKDSQAIIAQSNTKPAVSQTPKAVTAEKPVTNATKPATSNTQTKANTSEQKPVKTVSTPKLVPFEIPKITVNKKDNVTSKTVTTPKTQTKVQPKTVEQPKAQSKTTQVQPKAKVDNNDFLNSNYEPKMQFDENGKRKMDLEPRVSHSVSVEDAKTLQAVKTGETSVQSETAGNSKVVQTNNKEDKKGGFPWWILFAGGTVIGGALLYLVFDAVRHSTERDASRLESFFSLSNQNTAKRRRREYYDIVNDDSLNWQEKYKRYTEKEQEYAPKKSSNNPSYVTNIGADKKALIMPNITEEKPKSSDKLAQTIKRPEKSHNDIIREKLQAKISQMEHSLAQTPAIQEPEDVKNDVKSEDNAIMNKISDVKLKSFSKPKTLKETQRPIIEAENISNNSYKEGRFVKLSDSPLSVNKRQSASTELNTSTGTGSKYLTNNGEMKMNKENENYLTSSLDEYLSILDNEETRRSQMTLTEALSQVKPSPDTMTRSGITNPISRNDDRPIRGINGGLVVKSGYNIDSERGIYLVNIDGVSALIGRIKGNTFMLKKFDRILDKQLQVRPENDHVYIVKAGSYKCLVDVTTDRMGTLIEI